MTIRPIIYTHKRMNSNNFWKEIYNFFLMYNFCSNIFSHSFENSFAIQFQSTLCWPLSLSLFLACPINVRDLLLAYFEIQSKVPRSNVRATRLAVSRQIHYKSGQRNAWLQFSKWIPLAYLQPSPQTLPLTPQLPTHTAPIEQRKSFTFTWQGANVKLYYVNSVSFQMTRYFFIFFLVLFFSHLLFLWLSCQLFSQLIAWNFYIKIISNSCATFENIFSGQLIKAQNSIEVLWWIFISLKFI